MLLSLMRKHAQSWIIKFIIAMIVLVFIPYFGYSLWSDKAIKVAEVNGEPISRTEYETQKNRLIDYYRDKYKDAWSDKLIDALDIKNRALEGLIQQKIESLEAAKLGLTVTKNEVREEIFKLPGILYNGRFDENRYRAIVSNAYQTTTEAFEKGISAELLHNKLEQFLTTFIVPSDQEILDYYRYANEKIKLSYVKFSPDEYKSSVKKDKEAIKAFFEKRKENYRIPEKIKIAYIKISPDKFNDKVKLDEDMLKEYYEDNLDKFTQPKQVKARHILFRIPPDASPEEQKKIEEKAASVLEKAKKGEDFAELAKKYSEGPTKTNGGELGYFSKGQMVKEFEDAAFSLKKGEISGLVKTSYGYHIIKVEDIKKKSVKPFSEVKDQIVGILTHNKAMDLANEKGLSLLDQLTYDVNLKKFAADHEEPYSSTEFFSKSKPIALFRGDSKLLETLFSLGKGDITDLVELNDALYIFQMIDEKNSYLPEFDEVSAAVEADYVDHMALESAKTEAGKYLKSLKEGGKWEELAKEQNRKIESTDYFTRGSAPAKIGSAPGLQNAAFRLNAKSPYPATIFENGKSAFVVKWEEKKDIDKTKYNEEKEKYAESLVTSKRQEAYSDWIKKMEAKSDIDRSYFKKYY